MTNGAWETTSALKDTMDGFVANVNWIKDIDYGKANVQSATDLQTVMEASVFSFHF